MKAKIESIMRIFKKANKNAKEQKMKKYSLNDISSELDKLALKIHVPSDLLPSFGEQKWDSQPFIEIDSNGFMYYVNSERGREIVRKKTDNIDDLLYWIFANVTFSMSCEYELKNRVENKDCRRIMFEKQEELLGLLNENWKQKEILEHQSILKNYPFDDLAGLTASFFGELREQGYDEEEILKLTYEKFYEK